MTFLSKGEITIQRGAAERSGGVPAITITLILHVGRHLKVLESSLRNGSPRIHNYWGFEVFGKVEAGGL